MRRAAAALFAALALCACEPPARDETEAAARPEPVVVYASYEDPDYLPTLFQAFTRESGIPVSVRHRPEQQIVSDVIGRRGSPQADVLLTRSVHGAWRAADEGALRPLLSESVSGLVPDWLRDPDGFWTATGFDTIEVACNAASQRDCDAVDAYADLAEPGFRGRLCLSSFSLAANRTLIAGLIADHGLRPAEMLVRGWITNLALPPYETEEELLQAVAAGRCALAVVSGAAIRGFGKQGIHATWPQPGYVDVSAAGIGRHAQNPDAARRLVDWLLDSDAQAAQLSAIGLRPVNPEPAALEPGFPAPAGRRNVAVAGLYATDAIKLAERRGWR
jgi:iron(III) transport system substrate-binding protein